MVGLMGREASSRRGLRLLVAPTLLILAGILVAYGMLTGCSQGETPSAQNAGKKKPVVLTTFTVIQDMAQQVAGDHLDVQSITKPGAEIHDYEPTPDDITRAEGADLVLDNGLGLERRSEEHTSELQSPG